MSLGQTLHPHDFKFQLMPKRRLRAAITFWAMAIRMREEANDLYTYITKKEKKYTNRMKQKKEKRTLDIWQRALKQ